MERVEDVDHGRVAYRNRSRAPMRDVEGGSARGSWLPGTRGPRKVVLCRSARSSSRPRA
jgi:hypothetical protein